MDAARLGALVSVQFDVVDGLPPTRPAKAVPRTYPAIPQSGNDTELGQLRASLPRSAQEAAPTPADDLEASRPGTPASHSGTFDAVEVVQSAWDPYMNRFRVLSAGMMNLGNGLNDSAVGALIPYLEKDYDIGYAVVSLIFVGNAMGFVVAALFIDSIRNRLGRAKALALVQTAIGAAYVPVVLAAPFPAVVVAFFVIGFGMSVNIALGNTFCGRLRNGTAVLGAMHAAYGLGGTVGPLIATALVTVAAAHWSRYYLLTLGVALLNAVFAAWSYRGYEASEPAPRRHDPGAHGMLGALSSRVVLLGALFIFAYQGAEVSISGWVISFLIAARGGDPSTVGYVTAGFWAGITLGRLLLSGPAARRFGEKAFVYAVVVGAAVFELLVWLVPHVVGDAVAVAFVGLLLGPVYPCAAAVFLRGMSRGEQVSGLGVISAFGSSGGAAAPFTTGLLAQAVGTFVLHPIALGLFGAMLVCWYGLPGHGRRVV